MLIGEHELPYTMEIEYNKIKHFVISFNQKVNAPMDKELTSENAEKLSREEILYLINKTPEY